VIVHPIELSFLQHSLLSHYQVLTDPDAPSRDDPKWSEFCHWIVTGLEAESATEVSVDLSKGKQIVKYMGPAPPEKTGKHRYVFLLYKGGRIGEMEGPKERKKWGNEEQRHGVRQWSAKYDLKLVGVLVDARRKATMADRDN